MIRVREPVGEPVRLVYRTENEAVDSRRRLKIAHLVSSLEVGGMERVVVRLATAQKEAGDDVRVFALRGGPLESDLVSAGIGVTIPIGGPVARAASAVRFFRSVKADIVHAHNPTSLHYAALSKLVSRPRIVVTVHGDQETHARIGSRLEWSLVSTVVVVSHAAANGLRLPCAPGKLTVIHNGIAPPVNRPSARDLTRHELGVADLLVGAIVARIDGRKGHVTLLNALSHLRDRGIELAVLVIGDGRQRDAVEALANQLMLQGMLKFLGSRSDVDSLLQAADFFVLPSDTEGLPMSLLEAMSHGLPIVAARVGGIPELISDGVEGLLVDSGDASALAQAILELYEHQPLRQRLGAAALARSANEFSLAATAQNYDRVYRRAITA